MRKKWNSLLMIIAVVVLSSCNNDNKKETKTAIALNDNNTEKLTDAEVFVKSIEEAHKKENFIGQRAIQFDLMLTFGGKNRFDGTITMTPNGDRIRMSDSATTMIWDGNKAMVAPDTSNEIGVRFTLFTWSYFFAASYKLSDPGTHHEFLGIQPLGDKNYTASKLTFDENIGDSPEDWYIVYREDSSKLMAGMAYIVTAGGTSKAEAENDPHLITYEAYDEVEGVPFATVWNFWNWNEEGEMEKLLGHATLKDIHFVELDESLFKVDVKGRPSS